MSRLGFAIAILAVVVPWDAGAATRPHIEPIERTPYSRDDNAPPTPLGFIIGTSALVVLVGGVGLGLRRRRRSEDRARWLAAHPGAQHDESIDPWLAREATEQARVLVGELDDAWAAGDQPWLREIATPELADALAPRAPGPGGPARRIDPYARLQVTFVTQLDAEAAGKDSVVVHVEGAVRDPRAPVKWVPLRRLLRRLVPSARSRRFAEFWTVARTAGEWMLVGVERDRTAPRSKAAHAAAPWAIEPAPAKR